MSKTTNEKSRRQFMKTSAAAAGAAAVAAATRGDRQVHAHEINAVSPTPEQIKGFMAMDHEGPIVMVNLLKFKPDGGAAEYAKYGAAVSLILEKIGAKILFTGQAKFCLLGDGDWDVVALVEYPNKEALFKMTSSPEYRAIHHHREAGLEGQINYAVVQTAGLSQ